MIVLYVLGIVNAIAAGYCAYSDMSRRGVQRTLYHCMMTVASVMMMVAIVMIET